MVVTWPSEDRGGDVLECVVNVSEGRDAAIVATLARAAGNSLLDVHRDADHHRSVLTLAGQDEAVQAAVRDVARAVVGLLDLRAHEGAHPRFGVLDVVPWVALEGWPLRDVDADGGEWARRARDSFAVWAASDLGLPVFLYGPERSLPQVRKEAWHSLPPDFGPSRPHKTAGSVAVGCRPLMVAYNLWLAEPDADRAAAIARAIRSPLVRALAFRLGGQVQVSCNLLRPLLVGPADVWDEVWRLATITRAELVGLVPESVLLATPQDRWGELDLAPDRTIEGRLKQQVRLHE